MKKHILRAIVCALLVCAAIITGSLCYWLPKRACFCYRARFYDSSKHWPIDELAMSCGAKPSEEYFQLLSATCEHGCSVWLRVFNDGYTITPIKSR